jgi:hypothetical protein
MKTTNNVTAALRQGEAGNTWEEVLSNATGSFEIAKRSTFRVRATGATQVFIDDVLAMTMSAGETVLFNSGDGNPDTLKNTVTIAIAAVAAYVQVSRELKRSSLVKNPYNQLG